MNNLRTMLCCLLLSACDVPNEEMKIKWDIAGHLPFGEVDTAHLGLAGPVTGLIDDVLVLIGGANFPAGMPWEGGKKAYSKEAYFFKLNDNSELIFTKKISFDDSVAYAANVSLKNSIYSIGGERNGRPTSDVFRYFISNDSLQRIQLPSLPHALTSGNAVYVNDYLYFVGGENESFVSDKVYRLHLGDSAQWEEFVELPNAVSNCVVASDDKDHIYILGGRKKNDNAKSTLYDEVYSIQVSTSDVTLLTHLPEALAAGTGGYYNGKLIMIGGDNASTFHKVETLLAAINNEENEDRLQGLILEKNAIQRNHPGFSRRVWMYDLQEQIWKELDPLEADSPVTTTAIWKDNTIIIPSGEKRAGVRTSQILLGKIH